MPQYNATVWPAMQYNNGGAVATTGDGGTADPPAQTPLTPQAATATEETNWTPPTAEPVETTYVNPDTTAAAIRTYFGIYQTEYPPVTNS